MSKDLWLPKNYRISAEVTIHSLLYTGKDWQIFQSKEGCKVLVVIPILADRWIEYGYLRKSLIKSFNFGTNSYYYFYTKQEYILAPVEKGKALFGRAEAIAFAFALRESRKISNDPSLHDAIYVEQHSILLPTWTLTPSIEDEVVLGTWLSGGVQISTDSFRRLSKLISRIPTTDLKEIIKTADFHTDNHQELLESSFTADSQEEDSDSEEEEYDPFSILKPILKDFILPGRPGLEKFFNDHVIDIIQNPKKYKTLGIDFPSAIILHGLPGCGKTFAVERLVEFLDLPSFPISSGTIGSSFIHETSKKISIVFDNAIKSAPSVIIIDEMESFLTDRRSTGTSSTHHVEEVAEFLRRIPEAINKHVLIIAMTNMIESIDPAILRRGRFDHIIEVEMPSREEMESLLKSLLSKLPNSDDIKLEPLLDVLTGKPLSDAAFVVREAARIAAKADKAMIDQDSLSSALSSLPKDKAKKSTPIGFGATT